MSEKKIQIESLREANSEIRDEYIAAAAPDHSRRQEAWRSLMAKKLVRGRASAARLQILLQSAAATENDRQALAAEVFRSFTEAISVLESYESAADESRCQDYSSVCSDLDSGTSRRSTAPKDSGRGHKRRRAAETRIVVSATAEDGRAWRKYGQKSILNAKHPRSYFRCTHKYDQDCKATKQVQRMDDGSGNYKITYMAAHTCGLAVAADHPLSPSDDSYNICFSDSGNNRGVDSTAACFLWPEGDDSAKGETTSGVTDETDILWSELKDFGNLQEMTTTTTTNQYCFSMGDGADSHVFGMDFYEDFSL